MADLPEMCMACFNKGDWLKPCPRCGKVRGESSVRAATQLVDKIIAQAGGAPRTMLTDGSPVPKDRSHTRITESGQQAAYVVLTPDERAKGFVRPVRRAYVHVGRPSPQNPLRDLTPAEEARYGGHGYVKYEPYPSGSKSLGRFWTQEMIDAIGKGCNTETRTSLDIAESMARLPSMYSGTFCIGCNKHLPIGVDGEFVWSDAPDQRVGT